MAATPAALLLRTPVRPASASTAARSRRRPVPQPASSYDSANRRPHAGPCSSARLVEQCATSRSAGPREVCAQSTTPVIRTSACCRGRNFEQHVAGLEVPVQEPPLIGRRGLADHVDRRGPYRRVGALRNDDGVGCSPRHILSGPRGGSQRVDRHELTGQHRDARLQPLIVEDRPTRQMCHQERGRLAMRGGRINRDQSRSRYARSCEQGQGAGLPVQPVLGVLHVDEGPQHQVTGGSIPRADDQPPHFCGDAAAQHLGSDDPFMRPSDARPPKPGSTVGRPSPHRG